MNNFYIALLLIFPWMVLSSLQRGGYPRQSAAALLPPFTNTLFLCPSHARQVTRSE